MELSLSDPNFCIRLLMDFPFACKQENETMLSDFLEENYKMPDEAWHKELTGGTNHEENESEPWNGASLAIKINEKTTLFVEYHPFETIFFFNDLYLGNTGGHYHLSLFTWNEFLQIVQYHEKESLLFFLLLPLVVGTKQERAAITEETEKHLQQLPFQKEHLPVIAQYLVNHCVFEDDEDPVFLEHEKAGIICFREHSERSPKRSIQDLIAINAAILTAMK